MTRLDAVNEILEGIGEGHVSTLGSSGTWPALTFTETLAGDAERILERETRKILAQGWFLNELCEYTIDRPTHSISVSGGAGTFTFDEVVTGGTSGATGYFNYIDTPPTPDVMYLCVTSGTFQAAETLTGGTSGATRTAGTITPVTTSKIAADPLWLKLEASECEYRKLSMVYDPANGVNMLVDMDPDSDTDPSSQQFTVASVRVDAVKNLDFSTLPQNLAQWCVAQAAVAFQRYKKGAQKDDAELSSRVLIARAHWLADSTDAARTNVLATKEVREFKGGRRGAGYGRW